MTEKQYKLEQWTSSSLYYSFPNGNLHHSIGKVIARVENDLNSLYNENEQLKTIRSDLISELDIVQNELNIAIDKGFAPSTSYKNYMASKKTEYDKFWENKIKTHNNTLKELKE